MDDQGVKKYVELGELERDAKRIQYECELRVKSYEGVIIRTDPRNETEYDILLERLHEEQQRCIRLANRLTDIRAKMLELEQSMGDH